MTALDREARAVARFLPPTVRVHTIGIGGGRLPGISLPPDDALVLIVGVAGALDPSLAVGDVVVDDPNELVRQSPTLRRGTVHSAPHVVATPADKAARFAATGASVVDMEQSAVRAWAAARGLPVVGLRAVSDTAAQTLHPAVVRLVTDVGRPRPLAIAAALVRRPGLIPYLRRLGADTAVALDRLGPAVRDVVDALER